MGDSVHDDQYHVECPLCDVRLPCSEFAIHYRDCALIRKKVVSQLKRAERRKLEFKCEKCDRTFKNRKALWAHRKVKHFWGVFKCPTCLAVFNYASELIGHVMKMGHSSETTCPQKGCNKSFPMSELEAHYEKCSTEFYKMETKRKNDAARRHTLVCDICGKISKEKRNYELHLAAHAKKAKRNEKSTDDEPSSFFCDKCGKEFFHKAQLSLHHSNVHGKIVKCEFCDYSCPKIRMRRHMNKHKEASFECGTCGKMLKTKQTLRAHEREHAGIQPFPCKVCGKGFTDNPALKQHLRLVHKITGPNAKPMRRELERGITAFTIDDAIGNGAAGAKHKSLQNLM